ncbi:4'-phosphopantetheinyl transferase superfamily protein [Streptomyces sp. 2112.3]|nr:4'-phosphopantetheinyl transferase superfamily protein [Streptomyces sp. 2112.3]
MRGDQPSCGAHSLNHDGGPANVPQAETCWDPSRSSELADGLLHIFSNVPVDIRQPDCLTAFLGRLLHCSPGDIRVTRDGFGRPVCAESPAAVGRRPGTRLCLDAGADTGRRFLALITDLPVALSVHTVPRGPVGELLLPFTPLERSYVQEAPAGRRGRRLAELWTRKEAALRLTGRGALAAADAIDALSGAREGKIVIPGSAAGPGGTAYVRELPAGPQTVACAATPAPVPGVRIWRANAPYGPVGNHGDAAAGAGSA